MNQVEKLWKQVVGLRAKAYNYLINDGNEDKKSKRDKKLCHKKKM